MRRINWNFISGLTVVLILLLVLSGYCVTVTRTLTTDLDRLIASNYDSIRAIRELRDATTRLNANYLKAASVADLSVSLSVFQHEREIIRSRVDQLSAAAPSGSPEKEKTALLAALARDYLDAYADYLSLRAADADRLGPLAANIAHLSGDIADAAGAVIELNEARIFDRRDDAVRRGRQANTIALGIAAFSIVVYFYTSWRMTLGVFRPLRELRDAIMRVSRREFDEPVPEVGGVELGQIAAAFNRMASELRAYISETDEKVVAANRLARAILEALPKPAYIVNNNLEVVLMNPRAEHLSSALEVPGRLPSVVRRQLDEAAARDADLVNDDMRRVIEVDAGAYKPGETGQSSFLPQVFRMRGEAGASEGWAVLLTDVTNLRRMDAAKSKAISTLGHEVKTPVTGIRMTLLLLLEEKLGPLNADQRELLAAGRDDCERLLAVLQALLDLARIEGGRAAFKLEPVPAADLVAQAAAMHGDIVRKSGLAFEIAAPGDLPAVSADAIHVVRVLGNFLSNAAKYGRPSAPVALSAVSRADGYVRFAVSNATDRPLTEAEQARVFDPFYRRSGESAEGTGLGLTISREIADAHGGRIGVWSEGGRVEFHLDLRQAEIFPDNVQRQPLSADVRPVS